MKNLSLLMGTIVGTLILIVGVAFFFSGSASTTTTAAPVDPAVLLSGANKNIGSEAAPVTIVEFSDFQCPACKATQPLVKQVLEQYPDKVRLVYRHYPLDQIHPNARLAAQASEVAQELGKFDEYHDLLFIRQAEWSDISNKAQLLEKFAAYAQELQIDKDTFLSRIESEEVTTRVQQDKATGDVLGVQGTPTFYVNNVQTAAPQLMSAVESALAQ